MPSDEIEKYEFTVAFPPRATTVKVWCSNCFRATTHALQAKDSTIESISVCSHFLAEIRSHHKQRNRLTEHRHHQRIKAGSVTPVALEGNLSYFPSNDAEIVQP